MREREEIKSSSKRRRSTTDWLRRIAEGFGSVDSGSIAVTGKDGESGDAGAVVRLSVGANGTDPLGYQWYRSPVEATFWAPTAAL